MVTRWKIKQGEYDSLEILFDGEWEQLNGNTAWTGKDNTNNKTARYKQAVRECLAQIVRDHNEAQGLRETLEAIAARIQGEYDNPALVKQGPLSTDIRTDCLNYAQAALHGATEKGE